MTASFLARPGTRFPEFDPSATYGMIIGGESVPSVTGSTFRCVDPFENAEWGYVPEASADDVDEAVRAARAAFPAWAETPAAERAEIFRRWSQLLREHTEDLARIQVHENGKTIAEMRGVSGSLGPLADFTTQYALSLHGVTVEPFLPGHDAWTRREPLGVVAAIAPWNNPLGLLAMKLFPALACGNTVVIKPSEVTPVSTLRFVQLAAEAGIPPGVINVVTGAGQAGAALVNHPGIDMVAFTGSTETGRRIAEAASGRFIRTTLELGGKGPQIVFPDADIDRAVGGLLTGIVAGTGQACNAGSRILIHEAVRDEVLAKLVDRMDSVAIGDPLDAASVIGPLASRPQYAKVTSYLDLAVQESSTELISGARTGTAIPGVECGLFVEPTLYDTPDPASRIRREEIFGPVGAVITFKTDDEAVSIANETQFGLVSGFWTQDVDRVRTVSKQLKTGVVWVNTWRAFSPNVPFGGMKQSGVGRELGLDLLHEYTETKAVWLGPPGNDE